MTPYATVIPPDTWFFLPTVASTEYDDGEKAIAIIWLQLEVGLRWYPKED